MNTRSVGRFVLCLGLFLVVTVGATAAQDAQFAASESIETQQTDAVTEVDQQVTDERPEREVGTQQADIVIQSINSPSTIAPDENLSVDYTLANQGGADGTESFVDLVVDGTSNNFDDTDADVNVSAGGTTSGTLTFDNVSGFFSDGDTINFSVELWDFGDSLSGTTDIVGLPALPGHDPPNDVDGDSLYEDADGDGQFDIFDVQAFFNNYNQPEVQNHDWAYDFDSDGSVDIFDVQQMFNNL